MTPTNGSLEAIVTKIHKLLAFTVERGASEHEAATATGHVQRLLAENNLSMATVEAAGGDAGSAGKREKGNVNRRQVYRWQRELMAAIAKLNYCHLTLNWKCTRSSSKAFDGYELIGRAANVATARGTFDYLTATIERLARDDVKDASQYFTRYAHSFKEGCSDRLVERLRAKAEELAAEAVAKRDAAARNGAGNGRALITLDDVAQMEADLNNDFLRGWAPGTTAAARAKSEADQVQRKAERAAKKAQAIADGVPANVAEWMSYGYSREMAEKMAGPSTDKPETDAQRRRREAQERRRSDTYWSRYEARQAREAARLDPTGYRRGRDAGQDVGLDPQVRRGSTPATPGTKRLD
jgi:hypothetical protein